MAAPVPSGGSSRLRVGGLALLGVGAVAGLIGIATLATGNGTPAAAPAPPTAASSTVDPPSPAPPTTAVTPSTESVPVPSFEATATNGVAGPVTTTPAAGAGSGSGSGVVKAPLRVYNNGTITGLAARAAADFRAAGWPVDQVASYSSGIIPTSTVYYRPGTGEQAAAKVLGDEFGLRVEPRFAGLTEASPGLIVIVTNDYQRR